MAKKVNADIQHLLDELAKDSNPGNVQYLKDGDTTLKLVLPLGRTIRTFFERFETTFESKKNKGQMEKFPYYLVAAVIVEADADGVADPTRVKFVKISKKPMADIVEALSKGWKLFDNDGPLINIRKGKGASGIVKYKTGALPTNFNIEDIKGDGTKIGVIWPDEDIADAARGQEESSAEYAAKEAVKGEALV